MPYISKRTLHHKSGFIPKGGVVPSSYRRLEEGLRRGWIVERSGPAARPPPVKEPEAVLPSTTSDPIPEQPVAMGAEIIAPDESPEYVESAIEDLDYLGPMAKKSLEEQSIVSIRDIAGWDVEALDELRGIGVKLAEHLLADFAKWKESFSEYSEPIEPEDENAEGETGETGEDEGSEDD